MSLKEIKINSYHGWLCIEISLMPLKQKLMAQSSGIPGNWTGASVLETALSEDDVRGSVVFVMLPTVSGEGSCHLQACQLSTSLLCCKNHFENRKLISFPTIPREFLNLWGIKCFLPGIPTSFFESRFNWAGKDSQDLKKHSRLEETFKTLAFGLVKSLSFCGLCQEMWRMKQGGGGVTRCDATWSDVRLPTGLK